MTRASAHLVRIFVAGLLAALPLAATIAIFWWAGSLVIQFVGPDSRIGGLLGAIGLGVTGSEVVGYLIGIGVVLGAIFALGLVVEAGLQRGLASAMRAVLKRIPLVSTVYDLAYKMVGLLSQRDEDGAKSLSAVWCHFGGRDGSGGAAVLALLSTPKAVLVDGRPYLGIIVPTAPVPVGGGLIFVPETWVTPADVGVEALTSIYVSLGVTASQHLKPAARIG